MKQRQTNWALHFWVMLYAWVKDFSNTLFIFIYPYEQIQIFSGNFFFLFTLFSDKCSICLLSWKNNIRHLARNPQFNLSPFSSHVQWISSKSQKIQSINVARIWFYEGKHKGEAILTAILKAILWTVELHQRKWFARILAVGYIYSSSIQLQC